MRWTRDSNDQTLPENQVVNLGKKLGCFNILHVLNSFGEEPLHKVQKRKKKKNENNVPWKTALTESTYSVFYLDVLDIF
jgi:predicted kinase